MDHEFLNACRARASSDLAESVRVSALEDFGKALESTHDLDASRFLADLIIESRNTRKVRMAAYWALRQIQCGLNEEDCTKRAISLAKQLHATAKKRGLPQEDLEAMGIYEERVKKTLLGSGRFPESVWNSSDEMDWSFVEQFAPPK